MLEPAALDPDLFVELTPIEVRGRVDRIDGDAGEPRGGAARSRAAAAAAPASFQVAMDLRYGQALACTRCLQPVRSEVTTHADLMVTSRPKATRAKDGGATRRAPGRERAKRAPAKKAPRQGGGPGAGSRAREGRAGRHRHRRRAPRDRAPDRRADPARSPDETVVRPRMPRPVPTLWRRPQRSCPTVAKSPPATSGGRLWARCAIDCRRTADSSLHPDHPSFQCNRGEPMPNPKHRHSKARRDKRRAHDALKPPGNVDLPRLRRGEAPAPRLPSLRLVPGARHRAGREDVDAARLPTLISQRRQTSQGVRVCCRR